MIKINYDDFSETYCDTLTEAKNDILEKLAEKVLVDNIAEIDEDDDEIKEYACEWNVTIVENS